MPGILCYIRQIHSSELDLKFMCGYLWHAQHVAFLSHWLLSEATKKGLYDASRYKLDLMFILLAS